MNSKFDQYDLRYLIEQYRKMKEMYERDDCPLLKEKMKTMKVAFKSYDRDGNGVLDRNEVVQLLSNHFKEEGVRKKPTKEDVDQFFANLDEDNNGSIDFNEFCHFLIQNMKNKLLKPLGDYLNSHNVDVTSI